MEKTKRIYKPLAVAVVDNLMAIFNENKMADKVIEKTFKLNPKWGARDRSFIAENTYGVVRWWRLIKFCAEIDQRKIKDRSVFEKMLATWLVMNNFDLPDWEEMVTIDPKLILTNWQKAQEIRKVRESVPDWLDEIGQRDLGENWDKELKAMNQEASVFLRVNGLKTTKAELQKLLNDSGIEVEAVYSVPDALKLVQRKNVFASEYFKKGFFEVQDAGSQLIPEFLGASPGMRVVDACAGAGGKSLQLGEMMQNKGKVIAMDIAEWKLTELKKRAKRNGIDNVETRLIEAKSIKRLQNSADRLLLDVPCSGLGVLKRNPDAKWKLKPEFIEEIKELQATILQDYSKMLKKGGEMVYATCSLLQAENEDQVRLFLRNNPDFEFIAEKRISPAETGFDGFYMAKMKRN